MTAETAASVADEFRQVLKGVFGTFLDAQQGFHRVLEYTEGVQAKLLQRVPGATPATLDASPYMYSDGPPVRHPDDPKAPWLHRTTHGELKERNRPGNTNELFVGNMCVVALYAYWEDEYRGRVARAIRQSPKGIQVPAFGDLRLIRNSIVHHRAFALPDIAKCELFRWFKPGDRIFVSTERFREIAGAINHYLDELAQPVRPSKRHDNHMQRRRSTRTQKRAPRSRRGP